MLFLEVFWGTHLSFNKKKTIDISFKMTFNAKLKEENIIQMHWMFKNLFYPT